MHIHSLAAAAEEHMPVGVAEAEFDRRGSIEVVQVAACLSTVPVPVDVAAEKPFSRC